MLCFVSLIFIEIMKKEMFINSFYHLLFPKKKKNVKNRLGRRERASLEYLPMIIDM